jgi:hypothetical protein
MNRFELQQLSDARIQDARVLVEAHRWTGAYYLVGYSVECALKACAARRFREHEVPDKTVVNDFYTHRLDRLLGISDIQTELEARIRSDIAFRANWHTVRDWNETTRYDLSTTETQARNLLNAISETNNGVQPWLKAWW